MIDIFPRRTVVPAVVVALFQWFLSTTALCPPLRPMTNGNDMVRNGSNPPTYRFITNPMCPFAQKVWIAFECGNISYQREEISLYGSGGKPDWFWKLNPVVPFIVTPTRSYKQWQMEN